MNKGGEGVDVSGLKLSKLAVFEDEAGDFVLFGEAFEDIDGGGDFFTFAVFDGDGEAEFVEENVAELLGRVDIELEIATGIDIAGLGVGFALEFDGHFSEDGAVDSYAGIFHAD